MIENLNLLQTTMIQTLELYMNIEAFNKMNKTQEIEGVFNKLIILIYLIIEFVINQTQNDKIMKDELNGDESTQLKASLLSQIFRLMQVHTAQVNLFFCLKKYKKKKNILKSTFIFY
jgi:hypothetical protein